MWRNLVQVPFSFLRLFPATTSFSPNNHNTTTQNLQIPTAGTLTHSFLSPSIYPLPSSSCLQQLPLLQTSSFNNFKLLQQQQPTSSTFNFDFVDMAGSQLRLLGRNDSEVGSGSGANILAAKAKVPLVVQEQQVTKTTKSTGKKVLKKICKGAKMAGKAAKTLAVECTTNNGVNQLWSQQLALFVIYPV